MAARVAAAGSLSMAEWLRVLADGRTAKQALAQAAGLAWELDRRLAVTAMGTSADLRNRERRPVGELLRELCECIGRVATKLERLPGGEASRELVAEVEAVATALDEAGI